MVMENVTATNAEAEKMIHLLHLLQAAEADHHLVRGVLRGEAQLHQDQEVAQTIAADQHRVE